MSFAPAMNQIADPEPGSFQHKAHVGIDESGNVVSEGEVDRRWSDSLNGPVRQKVSLMFGCWIVFEADLGICVCF
jgi:hypothetical protein